MTKMIVGSKFIITFVHSNNCNKKFSPNYVWVVWVFVATHGERCYHCNKVGNFGKKGEKVIFFNTFSVLLVS